MKLGDMPAFPCEVTYSEHGELQGIQTGNSSGIYPGMTLRQHYAGLAMAAMIEARWSQPLNEKAELAKLAVEHADALLAALEKQP